MSRHKLALAGVAVLVVGLVLWANMREVEVSLIGDTQELAEDQFWYEEFALMGSAEVRLSAELLDGQAVDLYLVNKKSYDGLQEVMAGTLPMDQLVFDPYTALSRPGLSGKFDSGWQRIGAGIYYVIVDHSVIGPTKPPVGAAGVRFRVAVETRQ